jgi:hypothetical protein
MPSGLGKAQGVVGKEDGLVGGMGRARRSVAENVPLKEARQGLQMLGEIAAGGQGVFPTGSPHREENARFSHAHGTQTVPEEKTDSRPSLSGRPEEDRDPLFGADGVRLEDDVVQLAGAFPIGPNDALKRDDREPLFPPGSLLQRLDGDGTLDEVSAFRHGDVSSMR